jgi:ring-1,2-phenylacetyl-CoA epoxidase subunit PaaC
LANVPLPADPLALYALCRADDALILGHRLSQWCGHAPMLEEDMALSNMALDLIGQARLLYAYASEAEGAGFSEDDYAYLRDAPAYRNLLMAALPNGDFAQTMLRQFFYAEFAERYWTAMMGSADATLAAIAAKASKEMAYHARHASGWVVRLGDGTGESRRRLLSAIDELWPYTGELFLAGAAERALMARGVATDTGALKTGWDAAVRAVFHEAGVAVPPVAHMQAGGRQGRHGEHLGHLLAELQYLQRAYPGARW